MSLERKIFIHHCLIGMLACGFFALGMWTRYQQNQIDDITKLLNMNLKELSEIDTRGAL